MVTARTRNTVQNTHCKHWPHLWKLDLCSIWFAVQIHFRPSLPQVRSATSGCLGAWNLGKVLPDGLDKPLHTAHLAAIALPRKCVWAWQSLPAFRLFPAFRRPHAHEHLLVKKTSSVHRSTQKKGRTRAQQHALAGQELRRLMREPMAQNGWYTWFGHAAARLTRTHTQTRWGTCVRFTRRPKQLPECQVVSSVKATNVCPSMSFCANSSHAAQVCRRAHVSASITLRLLTPNASVGLHVPGGSPSARPCFAPRQENLLGQATQ